MWGLPDNSRDDSLSSFVGVSGCGDVLVCHPLDSLKHTGRLDIAALWLQSGVRQPPNNQCWVVLRPSNNSYLKLILLHFLLCSSALTHWNPLSSHRPNPHMSKQERNQRPSSMVSETSTAGTASTLEAKPGPKVSSWPLVPSFPSFIFCQAPL